MSRHLALDVFTGDLIEATDEALVSENVAYVASYLIRLRDLKADVAGYYRDVEQRLLELMGERRVEITGLGVVESHRRTKRTKWDYETLIPTLVARALDEREVDPETGEFREREGHTVARVLRECVSFSGGKVTGLRARGLEPDEFCEEQADGWSVQLPPRDHEQDVA